VYARDNDNGEGKQVCGCYNGQVPQDVEIFVRIVIANTETLHDKINQLAIRVRQLEDALAADHALTTREPHPLLTDDLLSIKNPMELDKGKINAPALKDEEPDDTLDALGSLCAFNACILRGGNLISDIQIHK
jgi:hypothetical protein